MKDNKKNIVSLGKYIFSITISFLIWDSVTWFILNLLLIPIRMKNNTTLLLISSFAIWILKSIIIISMTYLNNKNKRVAKYQLEKAKITSLIIFYVFIIGLYVSEIVDGVIASPIIWGITTIIHIFLIAYVNEIMFKRWIYDEKK